MQDAAQLFVLEDDFSDLQYAGGEGVFCFVLVWVFVCFVFFFSRKFVQLLIRYHFENHILQAILTTHGFVGGICMAFRHLNSNVTSSIITPMYFFLGIFSSLTLC